MNYLESLNYLREIANNCKLTAVAKEVLDNERFMIWTATANKNSHHYGKGGLVIHTAEVAYLCSLNYTHFHRLYPDMDFIELFLSALFHDFCKIYDYTPLDADYKNWENSEYKYRIHHISGSAIFWNSVCDKYPFELGGYKTPVTHAILAHHGAKEYGSPVLPRTRTAWMLHLCDSMSARMYDCYTNTKG